MPYDIIAGTATAGIPWVSWVAYKLQTPMIYVRAAAKEHGKKGRIEGGLKAGQRVLLVEDLINTGSSSVSSIDAIREAGGVVEHCLAIVTYSLKEAKDAFAAARCEVHALVGLDTLLQAALEDGKLSEAQCAMVRGWQRDPKGWYGKAFGRQPDLEGGI
jgi:orotate phosphoribosyltransferase